MRNSFYSFCIALFVLSFACLVSGQAIKSPGGPMLIFSSETEPPAAEQGGIIGSIQTTKEKNIFSRAFVDQQRGKYFGYDLTVETITEGKQYRLSFKPLSSLPEDITTYTESLASLNQRNAQTQKLKSLPLPKYPEPQTVDDGDTLAVEVLVNQQTGAKIIDLIKVVGSYNQNSADTSKNSLPLLLEAKDFEADKVRLKIFSSKLSINGQPVASQSESSRLGFGGAVIWLYLLGRGRFILSLVPRLGFNFQKAGEVQGNKINFSIGGDKYEWISGEAVVTSGDEKWNLWVLHDKSYVPETEPTKEFPYLFGSANSPDLLFKKK